MSNNFPFSSFKKGEMAYLLFLVLLVSLACPGSLFSFSLFTYHQVAMGTVVEITLVGENEERTQQAALQGFHEIKRIEQLMSPWIESSDVSRINRSAGKEWAKVTPETLNVIKKALEISKVSEGSFDITVGPLVQLWRDAREKGILPDTEEIGKIRLLVDYKDLVISRSEKISLKKRGMSIDLGGIAKGYAVDRAFELLKDLGYGSLVVNAGGDLRVGGTKPEGPWSIGIQHPRDPQKIMARISLSDTAITTSGDYEKFFLHQGKRYHHILNPRDGFPAEGCQSITILYKDCMTADALATAIFVLGPTKGYSLCQRLEGVDCLIVDTEGNIAFSPGLKGRIFPVP